MSTHIAPIVEGQGDVAAVPILLRKLREDAMVSRPVRMPKTKLVKQPGLLHAFDIAASNIPKGNQGLVLVVIDADEDCAAHLGPQLLGWMTEHSPMHRCFVALCVREFESWIVGGINDFNTMNPDTTGGLKKRICEHNDGRYKETADQPRFTAKIDVELLRDRSPSFLRLSNFLRQP